MPTQPHPVPRPEDIDLPKPGQAPEQPAVPYPVNPPQVPKPDPGPPKTYD
jgi:hypothetical protein